jgi:hypothetical protein
MIAPQRLDSAAPIGLAWPSLGAKIRVIRARRVSMNLKTPSSIAAAAAAGLLAACGGSTPTSETPEGTPSTEAAPSKDCCRGLNECKNQGGCAVEGKSECKGSNECKGQGGCNVHCPE